MKRIVLTLNLIFCLAIVAFPAQTFAADRIMTILTNGDAYLKEGGINSGWRQLTAGVSIGSLSLSGDRMTVFDQGSPNKTVSIKEPAFNSQWDATYYGSSPSASKALVSQLSNGQYRLLVLRADGSVIMKDGPYNAGWWSGTVEASGVSDIVIGGDRIGIVTSGGDFKVKHLTPGQFSHPNDVAWSLQTTNVASASLTNQHLAIVDISGNVRGKSGSINAGWWGDVLYNNTSKVHLSGYRMCVLKTSNNVECKEGDINYFNVTSKLVYDSATDVKINSNRIAVRTSGNNAFVLEGPIYGANSGWQQIGTNVGSLELN